MIWQPPCRGNFLLNVDVALNGRNNSCDFGSLAKDSLGQVVFPELFIGRILFLRKQWQVSGGWYRFLSKD